MTALQVAPPFTCCCTLPVLYQLQYLLAIIFWNAKGLAQAGSLGLGPYALLRLLLLLLRLTYTASELGCVLQTHWVPHPPRVPSVNWRATAASLQPTVPGEFGHNCWSPWQQKCCCDCIHHGCWPRSAASEAQVVGSAPCTSAKRPLDRSVLRCLSPFGCWQPLLDSTSQDYV